ncbi:uncharacterized protein LOC121403943 [Drosophila obscura]|uniref:uncharacterized protein LOC121403943 n=1 Tax=Drosophila obscura TaxID=7282 RepID=UPI001BB1B955|nr:uncharacterized protein LOC121403943 [Drosophila obscura]
MLTKLLFSTQIVLRQHEKLQFTRYLAMKAAAPKILELQPVHIEEAIKLEPTLSGKCELSAHCYRQSGQSAKTNVGLMSELDQAVSAITGRSHRRRRQPKKKYCRCPTTDENSISIDTG